MCMCMCMYNVIQHDSVVLCAHAAHAQHFTYTLHVHIHKGNTPTHTGIHVITRKKQLCVVSIYTWYTHVLHEHVYT